MDEREKEIQQNGDFGQGERLVDAKARRQQRGASLNIVTKLIDVAKAFTSLILYQSHNHY